jgi:hypothetical protein
MIFHGIAVRPESRPLSRSWPARLSSDARQPDVLFVERLHPASCRFCGRWPGCLPTLRTISAPLAQRIASSAALHQFYTVRLDGGIAYPALKGSGDITSLSKADGYIEIPVGESAVEAGAVVDITFF